MPATFGGFLNYEMRRRGLSAREFAQLCEVSHNFMARHLNHGFKKIYGGTPVGDPDLDSLIKIAKATGMNTCALIRLVRPDAPMPAQEGEFSSETIQLAQRIIQLGPIERLRADEYLLALAKSKQE
jgi:hypothetical protein